ncbi:unnamed protein product [Cercospora beticola]|nr:unnamed protein product [Cercospora beticola]
MNSDGEGLPLVKDLELLTVFPTRADVVDKVSTASWSSQCRQIKLGASHGQTSRRDFESRVEVAFAALLWAFTSDATITFTAAELVHGSMKNSAFHVYDIGKGDSTRGPSASITHRTRISTTTVASGGSLLLHLSAESADDPSTQASVEPINLERTPLRVACGQTPNNDTITVLMCFDQNSLAAFLVEAYSRHFAEHLRLAFHGSSIGSLHVPYHLVPQDKLLIQSWGSDPHDLISQCIHDCISEMAHRDSNRIAVEAWDGSLTRGELERAANDLATTLLQAAVLPRSTIGIMMDKSIWGVVAMLAVCKAGAAFVLLDPSLPMARLRAMTDKLSATHLITSRSRARAAHALVSRVIVNISKGEFSLARTGLPEVQVSCSAPPVVKPSDTALYIFTSGSSGSPKAIAISHEAWATRCAGCCEYGVTDMTRVLQYASCSFLVAVADTLGTLIAGGTVTILSSEERMNDLHGAMRRLQPNYASITPSVAKALELSEVPSIQSLLLVGEPIPRSLAERLLHSRIKLLNGYGQSEICGLNSVADLRQADTSCRNIGRSKLQNYWIVDPNDHERLMPVGGLGELVVEGYAISQGYVSEPSQQAAAAYISAPNWAASFTAPTDKSWSWYKTGDLVQYQANGDLYLFGRKDTQLKVRGQRVEAAEVEHHITHSFKQEIEHVVVDKTGTEEKLTAFVVLRQSHAQRTASSLKAEMNRALCTIVPAWMVPEKVVLTRAMPLTATGKLDRRALRRGHGLTVAVSDPEDTMKADQQHSFHAGDDCRHFELLASLCHKILGVDVKAISTKSDWYSLGGDSLSAMRLVKEVRTAGLRLRTNDLMTGRALADICATLEPMEPDFDNAPMHQSCSSTELLPMTDFQEQYAPSADGSDRGELYKYHIAFRGNFDIERLGQALHLWVQSHEALRISFERAASGCLSQRVLPEAGQEWRSRVVLLSAEEHDMRLSVKHDYMKHPVLILLHRSSDKDRREGPQLTLHICHSVFDGMSINHLWHDLVKCYTFLDARPRPSFAQYLSENLLTRTGDSVAYWTQLLDGSSPTYLRSNMAEVGATESTRGVRHAAYFNGRHTSSFSVSTLVYAAWSLVLSVLANKNDIVFLCLVHGRDEDYEGSSEIVGCCVSEIPCRVRLQDDMSPGDLLRSVQHQMLESTSHAHLGARIIASRCTSWPQSEQRYDLSTMLWNEGVANEDSFAVGDAGYMHVSEPIVERRICNDFDIGFSSACLAEVCFEFRCRAALYSEEEVHAVAKAFLEAMQMLSEDANHDSVRAVIADLQASNDLPIVDQGTTDLQTQTRCTNMILS